MKAKVYEYDKQV